MKFKIAYELKCFVSEVDQMDSKEFDDWFLYFKLMDEESKKSQGKKPKGSGHNSSTVHY